MSGRQDYISKVRYRNDLPPPNCPPKLLKYKSLVNNHDSIVSSAVLSSLFRKQNFKKYINLDKDNNINDPLSLDLDLIELPGIFDENDNSALFSLPFSNVNDNLNQKIKLHEKDKELLKNPLLTFKKKNAVEPKPTSNVAFLRKTEYISNKSHFLGTNQKLSAKVANTRDSEKSLDPESQLENIEASFEKASETLTGPGFESLKHPIKKHLKAVKAWSLVPNTEMMDQAYFSTKFIGSASLSRSKHKFVGSNELKDTSNNGVNEHNPVFTTSIFKPITLEDEEWMSLFTINDINRAGSLKRKIDDQKLDEEATFKFSFNRDFDLKYDNYESTEIKQVAINLAPDSSDNRNVDAKYLPIQGRIELKKKRLNPKTTDEEENVHFDQVNFTIRDSTANEEAVRDQERSRFDPYNYVAQIDEEFEEGEEAQDEEVAADVEEEA